MPRNPKQTPAEIMVADHIYQATRHVSEADSWVRNHFSEIGVDLEQRWGKILRDYPDTSESLRAHETGGGCKEHCVFMELVGEGHTLCKPLNSLELTNWNELAELLDPDLIHSFLKLKLPQTAHEFCKKAQQYATGENPKEVRAFATNPRQAVITAALQILRKYKERIDAPWPGDTPQFVVEKLKAASIEAQKAIECMEQARAPRKQATRRNPLSSDEPIENSPGRYPL